MKNADEILAFIEKEQPSRRTWLAYLGRLAQAAGKGSDQRFYVEIAKELPEYTPAILWTYDAAIVLCKSAGDDCLLTVCLINKSKALFNIDQTAKADELLREALRVIDDADDEAWEFSANFLKPFALHNLATNRELAGDHQEALTLNFQALALRQQNQDERGLSIIYVGIANSMKDSGQFREARRYYQLANSNAQRHKDWLNYARSWTGLGETALLLQAPGMSLDLFKKAIRYYKKAGQPSELALGYASLGNAYQNFVELTPALAGVTAKKILSLARKQFALAQAHTPEEDIITRCDNAIRIAHTYLWEKQTERAVRELLQIQPVVKTISNFQLGHDFNLVMAACLSRSGDVDGAVRSLKRAAAASRRKRYLGHESDAELELGTLFFENGKKKPAIQHLRKAIALNDLLVEGLATDRELAHLHSGIVSAYQVLIYLYMKENNRPAAYNTLEESRSRILRLVIALGHLQAGPQKIPLSLLSQEKELLNGLRAYLVSGKGDDEVGSLRTKLTSLRGEMAAYDPDYSDLREGRSLTFEAVKSYLS